MSHHEAQSACVNAGGNLATITRASEFDVLRQISAQYGGNTWLGLYDKTNGANCPRSRSCADWTWYSGEPTTYLIGPGQRHWDHPWRAGQTPTSQAYGNNAQRGAINEPNNWPEMIPSLSPAQIAAGFVEHGAVL